MSAPLGNPFSLGATGIQTTARTDRLALGALFRPSATALGAVSGILYGPAGTRGDLTLLTDVLLRVDPFLAIVQGTNNTQQGQYLVPNTSQRDLAVPAKDASLFRRALVQIRVADSLEAGVASTAATDGAWLEIKSGVLAASNPALPPLDANSVALGELSIPSTASGQPVTLTRYEPRTTSRGGILPVAATDTAAPAFDGQYRDHPTYGLQRGYGGTWRTNLSPPRGQIQGLSTTTLATGVNTSIPLETPGRLERMTHVPATGRLVCQEPGTYLVSGQVNMSTQTTGFTVNRHIAFLFLNGVLLALSQNRADPATSSTTAIATATMQVELAAGDYLQLGARQDTGANRAVDRTQSFLQAVMIGLPA